MVQRKIEHPLRVIQLNYDDAKPETDFEKDLLRDYLLLHDRAAALLPQKGKLLYEYDILKDQVTDAAEVFRPVEEGITKLLQEAEVLVEKVKDAEAIADLEERMSDLSKGAINDFHQLTLTPLREYCESLHAEYKKYDDEVEKLMEDFHSYNDTPCGELYKNWEVYSLDLNSYDDDEQEYRKVLDDLTKVERKNARVIDYYNGFLADVTDAYSRWEDIKRELNVFYNESGLLDSSLSDSFADGTGDMKNKPNYLIPPGDERIEDFRLNYGKLAQKENHTISVKVPVEIVQKGDVIHLQDVVLMLQHFPKMIEKWIFAIRPVFLDNDGVEMSDDDWKGHEAPTRWFSKLNSFPCVIFFIEDRDARHYMLMGDLLLDGKLKPLEDSEEQAVIIEGEAAEEIQNRLFNACWVFLMYCHNTGFDPQPYIEALMSEFDAAFSYEELKEKCDDDIAKGVQLRPQPMKGGKPL